MHFISFVCSSNLRPATVGDVRSTIPSASADTVANSSARFHSDNEVCYLNVINLIDLVLNLD